MTTIQALLLLACLACLSPPTSSECGVRHSAWKNGRIIGGDISPSGKWPWQVAVISSLENKPQDLCGGTLVSQKHIITAAHCYQPSFNVSVRIMSGGSVNLNHLIPHRIEKFIVHPQYDFKTFENDIAVVIFEEHVNYDVNIAPICMPDIEDDFAGHMAWSTGWGLTKNGSIISEDLREVEISILENQVCQDLYRKVYGYQKMILNSFLCAGNGKKGVYQGDSGGPLVVQNGMGRWMLVGVTSHGVRPSYTDIPNIYTRITYFLPWLQSFIDDLEF